MKKTYSKPVLSKAAVNLQAVTAVPVSSGVTPT
jgi:hypothetical protein